MSQIDQTRERLSREDRQYRHLTEKHQEYEKRLAELQHMRFLNSDEQIEEVKLKKLKLSVKDEMERLVQAASA